MKYRDKTKDELIIELQKLQHDYDSLNTSYEKEVTQRKQVEKDLIFNRLILNNAADTMTCMNYDGRFIDVNNAFCRSVNYSREELLSMTIHDIDPNYPAEIWPEFMEKLKQAGSLTFESMHRTKEARLIPVEITTSYFEYKGKGYQCGFVRDITERKKTEEMLHRNEMKLKTLFEILPVGISILDAERNIVFVNPALEKILNMTKDSFIRGDYKSRNYLRPDGTQMPEEEFASVRAIREQKTAHNVETGVLMEDGKVKWMNVNASPVAFSDWKVVIITSDLTERKKTEETLRLEKENFRRTLDDSPLGVRIATIEGSTIYANKALLNLYGYDSLNELQKTPLKDRYTPESYAQAQQRKHQREHGDLSATEYEISIIRKNGEIRHLQVFRKEVLWDGVRQFQVICNDITRRKQAEKALNESEERYRRLVDGSPDAIAVLSKGRIVFVNPDGVKLIGAGSPKELIGKPILDFVHPDSRSQVIERLRHVVEGKEAPLVEEKFLKFDGSVIDVEVVGIPFSYQGQAATQVIVRDITERKKAETALRKSEKKVSEALEFSKKILVTSSIGILTYKKSGQCVSANVAAAKATGATIAQLLAQNFHEISSWKKSGMYQAAIKALDTGIEQLKDVHFTTTFGKDVWMSFSFSSFDSEGEKHLLVFATDITECKKAEEEIRKSKELLEDLHKHLNDILENERALISREIHDQIGQSLTALKLDLKWMHKYSNTNPEAVAKIDGMIELVSSIIKDIQRISSDLRPGILDDLGLTAAIEWYSGEFEQRTGIRCRLTLDDSISGNSQNDLIFFRVLQEALTNVIRHANASSVSIILRHSKQGTTMTIQDNGIGITDEMIESTKALGLIGMRERVRQSGGRVNISSRKGQGTKLTVFISEKKNSA
ncbi:MAG: PAS domain S-box protein [Bacteroidales bacterium]|jgi:PAS domain S-box-containing protein